MGRGAEPYVSDESTKLDPVPVRGGPAWMEVEVTEGDLSGSRRGHSERMAVGVDR